LTAIVERVAIFLSFSLVYVYIIHENGIKVKYFCCIFTTITNLIDNKIASFLSQDWLKSCLKYL
jgi:hypothetical protein